MAEQVHTMSPRGAAADKARGLGQWQPQTGALAPEKLGEDALPAIKALGPCCTEQEKTNLVLGP